MPVKQGPNRLTTELRTRFTEIRKFTESITAPLTTEDYVIQAVPDVSPAKWHLAHTTWFFERFLLMPHFSGYTVFHPLYDELFNSYYETVGRPFPRPHRGLLSRPTVDDIFAYRHHVDDHIERLLLQADPALLETLLPLIELGLNHEQQHQELLFTDILYNLSINPLQPTYHNSGTTLPRTTAKPIGWRQFEGGIVEIGDGTNRFSFDNESPRHKVWLDPYALATRPVTNGEFLQFMDAGGYDQVQYWLSDGWATVKQESWRAPLYWEFQNGEWTTFTLSGRLPVDLDAPVTHVSYYEADAYARFVGKRLPTEAEWENAFADQPLLGNFAESGAYRPLPAPETNAQVGGSPQLLQGLGDVWEWTMSPYVPYPGNRPLAGALGEYNAKFMANQMVLRGGSCVTPASHIRLTYRNFFQPEKRWQFTGFRLAGDVQ